MYGKINQFLLLFCLLTSACTSATPGAIGSTPSAAPIPLQSTRTPIPISTPPGTDYSYPIVAPTVNEETSAAYPALKETQAAEVAAVALTQTAWPTLPPQPPTPTFTPTLPDPTLAPMLPKVELEALILFDQETGWALQASLTPSTVGRFYNTDRKILRTTSGFANWRDVTPPSIPEKARLQIASFLNANIAVVVFYRDFLPDSADTDLTSARTVDGGQTWQVGETMHTYGASSRPVQVKMLDTNYGWMMTGAQSVMGQIPLSFYTTIDGGLHWKRVFDSNEQYNANQADVMVGLGNPFGNHGFSLIDSNTAWYASGGLYRSEDSGKSWQQVLLPIPTATSDLETQSGMGKYEPAAAIPQFWTKNDGVLVGRYYTNNLEWRTGKPTDLPVSEFIYYTQDGGKTWTFNRSPARTGIPYFLDSMTGWYLGKSDPDPATLTQLYRTTDSGQTWIKLQSDSPLPLGSVIHFIDARVGYASQTSYSYDYMFDKRAIFGLPYFFFTLDGGRTWKQVEPKIIP